MTTCNTRWRAGGGVLLTSTVLSSGSFLAQSLRWRVVARRLHFHLRQREPTIYYVYEHWIALRWPVGPLLADFGTRYLVLTVKHVVVDDS